MGEDCPHRNEVVTRHISLCIVESKKYHIMTEWKKAAWGPLRFGYCRMMVNEQRYHAVSEWTYLPKLVHCPALPGQWVEVPLSDSLVRQIRKVEDAASCPPQPLSLVSTLWLTTPCHDLAYDGEGLYKFYLDASRVQVGVRVAMWIRHIEAIPL